VALQELIQGRGEICHSCNIEEVRSRACYCLKERLRSRRLCVYHTQRQFASKVFGRWIFSSVSISWLTAVRHRGLKSKFPRAPSANQKELCATAWCRDSHRHRLSPRPSGLLLLPSPTTSQPPRYLGATSLSLSS
jgi:hypothetical protein